MENDDQSAQRLDEFFRCADIDPAEVAAWSAYTSYVNSTPSREQLGDGVEPLRRLVALMPRLRAVIQEGKEAADRGFARRPPGDPDL